MLSPVVQRCRRAFDFETLVTDVSGGQGGRTRRDSVPSKLRTTFVTNLLAARAKADISQRKLAELSGVSQKHISQIEGFEASPSLEAVEKLALALGTTAAKLLTPPKK